MTIKQNSNIPPQSGSILTYTVTNERGWNDPPTSVFSPNSTTGKKRIDPRKRVAHDLNGGIGSRPPPCQQPVMNGAFQTSNIQQNLYQNFNNMSISANQPSLHHANSNPDLYSPPVNLQPMMHHAMSVPNKLNASASNNKQYPPSGTLTPPNSINNSGIQTPVYSNGTNTPPNMQTRKFSAPGISDGIFNSDIFQNMGTPTMLQSSHLKSKTVEQPQPAVTMNGCVTNGAANYYADNTFTNHTMVPPYRHSPVPPAGITTQPQSLPPMPVTNSLNQNNMYGRCNSTPNIPPVSPVPQRVSPNPPFVAPPPVSGYYAKGVSPRHSGRNSPASGDNCAIENDSHLLKESVKRLDDCREKCLCYLTNKVNDDISKRINVFKQSWMAGKLSNPVKVQMADLATALEKREFAQADSIHRALVVTYSSEVMAWMVGIKKLISSYQQVMQDNNQYQ